MQENKRKKSPIKSRILQYLEYKGVSEYEFYKDSGVARSTLKQTTGISEENIAKFLSYARDISPLWILTGEGVMLLNNIDSDDCFLKKNKKNIVTENVHPSVTFETSTQDNKMSTQGVNPTEETTTDNEAIYFNNSIQLNAPTLQSFPSLSDRPLERQQVPLYDIDARAGIVPILDGKSIPVDYISIPNLPKCDGGLNVRGDSMYPLLQSGDLVLFKNINDFKNIVYGEMYLISFHLNEEEYCVIKYLQKSRNKDTLNLTSHNDTHSVMEINKANIRALAIVKASVRYNTMV